MAVELVSPSPFTSASKAVSVALSTLNPSEEVKSIAGQLGKMAVDHPQLFLTLCSLALVPGAAAIGIPAAQNVAMVVNGIGSLYQASSAISSGAKGDYRACVLKLVLLAGFTSTQVGAVARKMGVEDYYLPAALKAKGAEVFEGLAKTLESTSGVLGNAIEFFGMTAVNTLNLICVSNLLTFLKEAVLTTAGKGDEERLETGLKSVFNYKTVMAAVTATLLQMIGVNIPTSPGEIVDTMPSVSRLFRRDADEATQAVFAESQSFWTSLYQTITSSLQSIYNSLVGITTQTGLYGQNADLLAVQLQSNVTRYLAESTQAGQDAILAEGDDLSLRIAELFQNTTDSFNALEGILPAIQRVKDGFCAPGMITNQAQSTACSGLDTVQGAGPNFVSASRGAFQQSFPAFQQEIATLRASVTSVVDAGFSAVSSDAQAALSLHIDSQPEAPDLSVLTQLVDNGRLAVGVGPTGINSFSIELTKPGGALARRDATVDATSTLLGSTIPTKESEQEMAEAARESAKEDAQGQETKFSVELAFFLPMTGYSFYQWYRLTKHRSESYSEAVSTINKSSAENLYESLKKGWLKLPPAVATHIETTHHVKLIDVAADEDLYSVTHYETRFKLEDTKAPKRSDKELEDVFERALTAYVLDNETVFKTMAANIEPNLTLDYTVSRGYSEPTLETLAVTGLHHLGIIRYADPAKKGPKLLDAYKKAFVEDCCCFCVPRPGDPEIVDMDADAREFELHVSTQPVPVAWASRSVRQDGAPEDDLPAVPRAVPRPKTKIGSASRTRDSSQYAVQTEQNPGMISRAPGQFWSSTDLLEDEPTVAHTTFVAGDDDPVMMSKKAEKKPRPQPPSRRGVDVPVPAAKLPGVVYNPGDNGATYVNVTGGERVEDDPEA